MARRSTADRPNRATRRHPTPTADVSLLGARARRLLQYPEAALYLGVSERTLRHLWASRRIAAVKVGKLVRFDKADLDRWIEDHRVEAMTRHRRWGR